MSANADPGPVTPRSAATTKDLEGALQPLLGAAATPVTILDRRPLPYCSTFPVEELSVWLQDDGESRLVFKDLSRSPQTDPTWRQKAGFLRDPLREIDCYREVLTPYGLPAPGCLGAVVEPPRERYWLFLERVQAAPLWHFGDLDVWCRAARWLAGMHACFTGRTPELPGRLLTLDADHWRRWLARARRMALVPGRSCSDRELERLERGHERAVTWLAGQPTTFLHGEFYPSNVLVERGPHGPRIRPVDWEMAATGPAALDLAALTSGGWTGEQRRALVEAYRLALPPHLRPPLRRLTRALDRCRLLLAVQWLGWSTRWTPPPEHEHDWLGTALDLVGRGDGRRGMAGAGR